MSIEHLNRSAIPTCRERSIVQSCKPLDTFESFRRFQTAVAGDGCAPLSVLDVFPKEYKDYRRATGSPFPVCLGEMMQNFHNLSTQRIFN